MDRSAIMRAVKNRNTAPERAIARMLKELGVRVRPIKQKIPGSPDFAFFKRKLAIFVHGCFWHGHSCRRGARVPRTNRVYWVRKIARNRARDIKVRRQLKSDGWRVLTIWECQLVKKSAVKCRLARFLM